MPNGRIILDSGVMNPEFLTEDYGEQATKIWAAPRLRPRVRAMIAHVLSEHDTGSHAEALKSAPDTRFAHRRRGARNPAGEGGGLEAMNSKRRAHPSSVKR
jgi:hypothetical protein